MRRILSESILKEELTPEQWKSFERTRDLLGIEEALANLPDVGDTVECYTMVNQRIKELRKEHGLTQNDLANVLDVSQREYWRYEQEGYSVSILNLTQIAIFYNVSLDWFSGFHSTRKPFFEEGEETMVNGYTLKSLKASKNKK